MRIGRRGLLLTATGLAAGPLAAEGRNLGIPATPGWKPPEHFMESLPGLMRSACLPGISIAGVEKGELAWTYTHGVTNVKSNVPVTGDTLFEAASASKPVFAYGVLQLVDSGKIDLDRPLAAYYKPAYLPDFPDLEKITARHALTHTSGLPDWADENKPETFQPAFAPGTFFSYSGEALFWLQLVVEKITGLGLDAFMRLQLFEPAGMLNSTFAGDAGHAARAAFGHVGGRLAKDQGWRSAISVTEPIAEKWGKPVRDWTHDDWLRAGAEIVPKSPPKRLRFVNAAGSLLTTATDYARFLALAMKRPRRASWEIQERTRQAMISPQVAVQEGGPVWWGLGWELEKWPGGWLFSHEGNNDNRATTYAGGDAASGDGMVVLANAGSGFAVYQRILRAATNYDQVSFIAELNPPRGA